MRAVSSDLDVITRKAGGDIVFDLFGCNHVETLIVRNF